MKVEAGKIAENIPRTMRVGKTARVEIRIAKASVEAFTEGLEGGGPVWQHKVTVTKAMAVRLRAPEGGFFIETVSPETQWIENNIGFPSDDFASWRFLVTPQSRGWSRLQIIVSARTIGADGVAAETALPDQIVEVKVRRNIKRALVRLFRLDRCSSHRRRAFNVRSNGHRGRKDRCAEALPLIADAASTARRLHLPCASRSLAITARNSSKPIPVSAEVAITLG